MKSVLHHASLLSQHACAAAIAIDQGDATTGYAHLLHAEHALRAAKREVQIMRPEAALNGVSLCAERAVLRSIACDHVESPACSEREVAAYAERLAAS